jgi:hypothetical protein
LTVHISTLIIYSGGTTGISHLKKHDLVDTFNEILEERELEVYWCDIFITVVVTLRKYHRLGLGTELDSPKNILATSTRIMEKPA